ncbi:AGPAT1 [Bugula neritina]|uniref:1-acyl-sn-glycerol-3-phosphate acyltransferase n=1 Tax=Bugula neritina TaxID=10212 RepID=A0A7J7K797_BUGNE|nr:AGPAT1 [Bugula neritina]
MFMFYFCLFLATVTLPLGLVRPFNPENHKVLSFIVPYLTKYILGITVEVRDGHNSKLNKPFVLLLNHQSSLDAFIMMHIWPDRCVTIMKRVLMYVFPFGVTATLFGCIFIDRGNRNNAQSSLEHAGQELKNRNVQICMYPEGTRNRDGHILPFKKGAFNLAVGAQVPLVPATVSCYRNFYCKKENKFTDGKVIVRVLPEVSTEGKEYADVLELTEQIRNSMVKSYEEVSAELGSKLS